MYERRRRAEERIERVPVLVMTLDEYARGAAETVLKDVRVLATDTRVDDQNKDIVIAKTATLEVTPKQAEVIAVTGEVGKMSLSLRSLARDETEAVADSGAKRITYTWDSDATRLIQGPLAHRPSEGSVE